MGDFFKWMKSYPMTAIMIVCCLIGAPFFGSQIAYEQYEAYTTKIICSNVLESWSAKYAVSAETEIDETEISAAQSESTVEETAQTESQTETVLDETAVQETVAESASSAVGKNVKSAAWHFPVIVTLNAQNTQADRVAKQEEVAKKNGFTQVDQSYFDDAVFIGDSRTDTLKLYAGWDNATYYVKTGTNIWSIMDEEVAPDPETGENISIDAALQKKQFGKVYIMLGVNELGVGSAETFYQQFKKVVARIQELQPNAIIFVESIIHVSPEKDAEGTVINNKEINIRNEWLRRIADKKTIFFIDANEVLDDANGALTSEYTFDGVHLKGDQLDLWKSFLFNHGIVR